MDGKLTSIYETLLAHYGELHWWPAENAIRGDGWSGAYPEHCVG
jgi:endonuclease III-like uncharacterized protein